LPIVPIGYSSQDSLSSPKKIACYIDSCWEKKTINGEEDEKILFDPNIPPPSPPIRMVVTLRLSMS
jgi:hypothetical protein